MIVLTKAQRRALFRVFQRDFPSWVTPTRRHEGGIYCERCGRAGVIIRVPSTQWREFRSQVKPVWLGQGAVMLFWHGMWLGIEPDGYTHS